MAHNLEPMDVDSSVCDFDNKENSFHNSNVLSWTPCTEKGYEELDVTELNMKLRYSITPAASPMSKSFTGNSLENRDCDTGDNENGNLTRSLNSSLIKSDNTIKSQKLLPLQILSTDQFAGSNRNALRPLDSTVTIDNMPVAVESNEIDENLLYPSSSSSTAHTPEATTPTKDIPKTDGASPIMRGLKSVLSMFRPSQSPIQPAEDNTSEKPEIFSPPVIHSPETADSRPLDILASTPLAAHRTKPSLSKRNSPNRDSIVFNEDLERELLWNDETTILFSKEKVPMHKLFFQATPPFDLPKESMLKETKHQDTDEKLDSTVEYMDVSYNNSTITDNIPNRSGLDSDSEFLDCETTFTKDDFQTDQDNQVTNNQDNNDLVKSSNATLSVKSLDMSTTSTETVMGKVNIDVLNTALVPEKIEDIEKFKEVETKQVASTVEESINNKHLYTENQLALNITVGNMSNNFTYLESTNVDLKKSIETTLLLTANNSKSDIMLKTDANVCKADVNTTQINETNIDNVNDIVGSPPICENVGVKSISQIPLIVDPKVLLFNIPIQSSVDDVQVPQNNNVLDTSPADIPLPDDEDNEKVTIPSTNLGHNDTVIIHESISILNVNTDPEIIGNIVQTPVEDIKDAKLTENTIYRNNEVPEVMKTDLLPIVTVEDRIDDFKCNVNKDCVLNPPQVNVATQAIAHVDAPETLSVTSHNDVNQDSEVIVANQEAFQLQSAELTVKNHAHIRDLEAEVVPLNSNTDQVHQTIVDTHEVFLAVEQENLINNANQVENTDVSASIKQLGLNDIANAVADIVVEDKIDIPIEINQLKPETWSVANATVDPFNDIIMSNKDIDQNSSVSTISVTENEETVPREQTHVDKTNQPEATVIPSNEIFLAELVSCGNNMLKDMTAITIAQEPDKVQVENILTNKEESFESEKELTIDDFKDTSTEVKLENNDKEIFTSEHNSPFVSVTADELLPESKAIENVKELENSCFTDSKTVQTPPSSPKIVSKGYNFNFDEIDDPFATKSKIRVSPPSGATPIQSFEQTDYVKKTELPKKETNKNIRKSQPERRKPVTAFKKSNISFNGSTHIKAETAADKAEITPKPTIVEEIKVDLLNNQQIVEVAAVDSPSIQLKDFMQKVADISNDQSVNKTNKILIEDTHKVFGVASEIINADDEPKAVSSDDFMDILNDQNKSVTGESMTVLSKTKDISSSEQSAYFSAGTSSNEEVEPKSVFNLPEMDGLDFNPFMTMTKIRRSPSISFESDHNTTNSSKATDDKDTTVREVHTEDEDTVEGPFLDTEDLDDGKLSAFDNELMQFNNMQAQGNDENAEELFIDAETFEFLLNQNQANIVSDSGKESLFLKFDPLFAKRLSSEGVLAALSKVQERMNTPKKISVHKRDEMILMKSPIAVPSSLDVSHDIDSNATEEIHEDVNITVPKPMMVVNPAVNPVVTCRNKTASVVGSNRRSLTFTSPAIAVIDKLLNLSSNSSVVGHETSFLEVNREQEEADRALTQLRELLADKEINVYNLRAESKELKCRLTTLESQMKTLESISEERLKKINELTEKLNEKTKINRSMASVVEEYERTIASLIAETEQDKKRHAEERIQLINERDEQTVHLTSMEVSFNDLHSKYEKSKQVILGFKTNEDAYKKSIKDFEENLSKMQTNYELLKQHATSKLNHANDELQKINRSHEAEVLKLNALIKRKELHITSLEETLAQKSKANEELTAICDELINKVG